MQLGETDLDLFPLGLGGNVFGGNASEEESFAVLDAYVDAGGNFIDTADSYVGGRSEEVIGRWLASRGRRDGVVIATKVGKAEGLKGLAPKTIRNALEGSLRRLGIDCVDLYYAHAEDPPTPIEETLATMAELRDEGKLRYIAASNFAASSLREALESSARRGLPKFEALQPEYNLVERNYEHKQRDLCAAEGISCVPYFALASGFLTGRYRPGATSSAPGRRRPDEARTQRAMKYLDSPRAMEVLASLEDIAHSHATSCASVAIAWLIAQPTVVSPLASARTPDQLDDLLSATKLRLEADEVNRLNTSVVL